MKTPDLIHALAESASPVRRLATPVHRAMLWLGLSLPYVGLVVLVNGLSVNLAALASDPRLLIEELAALATAVTAAIAVFSRIVPGRSPAAGLLPLLPAAIWLASTGAGCFDDWSREGRAGLALRLDWTCFPSMALVGILPFILMAVLIRRGVPMAPRSTVALGALAVAALANFGLQLFHAGDLSVMILVWHIGGAFVVAGLAAALSPRVFSWRHLDAPARAARQSRST